MSAGSAAWLGHPHWGIRHQRSTAPARAGRRQCWSGHATQAVIFTIGYTWRHPPCHSEGARAQDRSGMARPRRREIERDGLDLDGTTWRDRSVAVSSADRDGEIRHRIRPGAPGRIPPRPGISERFAYAAEMAMAAKRQASQWSPGRASPAPHGRTSACRRYGGLSPNGLVMIWCWDGGAFPLSPARSRAADRASRVASKAAPRGTSGTIAGAPAVTGRSPRRLARGRLVDAAEIAIGVP